MQDLMNPTISQACEALAPEDRIDFACGNETATKAEGSILLGRKVGCVMAGLKIVSLMCRALDGDDDEAPAKAEAEGYLALVTAWAKKPSPQAEAEVAEAFAKSDFFKPARRTKKVNGEVVGETFSQPDYTANPLRKACYHAVMACLAKKPSDAASHVSNVASTAARAIEFAAGKESGWAHARIVGVLQSETL